MARETVRRQATIRMPVTVSGVGVHSGIEANLTLLPAETNSGIVFRRTDEDGRRAYIPARYDLVKETRLGTTLTNQFGVSVATVEHLLAALAGLGIDNLAIEIDGPEIPIADGSALEFVRILDRAGIQYSAAPQRLIRVVKPIEIVEGDKRVALLPSDKFSISYEIDFAALVIGRQKIDFDITPKTFRTGMAPARTFGFAREVEALRALGFARGGSLENAIVISDSGDAVLNPEPLRFVDEFVRHKALDALGDLSLAEAPLLARYEGRKSGHDLNNRLLRALFADPEAWRLDIAKPEKTAGDEPMHLAAGF